MSTFTSPSKDARNDTKSMYVTETENLRKVSSMYMTDVDRGQSGVPGNNSEWPPVPDKPVDFPK